MKFELIWYDLEGEKGRDIIDNALSKDDATSKGFEKYNGNPPASLVQAIPMEA
jgi:hypothetical protein